MAKPAAGEQMAGNLEISQACRLQNPNESMSFKRTDTSNTDSYKRLSR